MLLARELIRIRAAYRYVDRFARDAVVAAFRDQLESEVVEPLSLRVREVGEATLVVDIVVPMFSDHGYASKWCELLGVMAIDADHDVRSLTL